LNEKNDDVDYIVYDEQILIESDNGPPRTVVSIDAVTYQKFNEYLDFKSDFNSDYKEKLRDVMLDLAVFVGVNNLIADFKSTTTSSSSFLVNGKKPRKDMLLKFAQIADELTIEKGFPYLKNYQIKACMKTILLRTDLRTFDKYYDTILNYSTKDYKTARINVEHFYELMKPHILAAFQ